MAITKKDVEYIANLARLGLTDQEIGHFQGQLEGILEYIDQLKKVDVSGVAATAHVLDLKNVYRQDVIQPSLDPEKALRIAPAARGNFYKVPRVIE
jgi:aspartyl-tRNA(Asn)/glutamyl-tRNA(Gln) amidotransferase subunit C